MNKTLAASTSTTSTVPRASMPRLATIDIGKGLGILLIVLGHNAMFLSKHRDIDDFLKAFLLPFFFFISGTTFVIGLRSVKTIAWTRADALLKPCAVVVIVVGLLRVLSGAGTVETLFLGLLFGTGFTLIWTPIWFLPHLWLLNVSAAALLTHGHQLVSTWLRRIALLLMMVCLGFLVLQGFDSGKENPACLRILEFGPTLLSCGLPFSADILLLTGVFFLLGHFLSNDVKAFRVNWLVLSLALAIMLGLHHYFGYTTDFNQRRYDSLFISTLQALCGIYAMLCVCSLLSQSALASRVLSYLGRGSLFILIFHGSIMLKLETLLPRWIQNDYLVAFIALVTSVVISLILWELTKRNRFASMLMLPRKQMASQHGSAALKKYG